MLSLYHALHMTGQGKTIGVQAPGLKRSNTRDWIVVGGDFKDVTR
jgi:hypothetical protein